MKDAQRTPSRVDSVGDMGQMVRKSLIKLSVMKDAPTLSRKDESVGRKIGRDAIHNVCRHYQLL